MTKAQRTEMVVLDHELLLAGMQLQTLIERRARLDSPSTVVFIKGLADVLSQIATHPRPPVADDEEGDMAEVADIWKRITPKKTTEK